MANLHRSSKRLKRSRRTPDSSIMNGENLDFGIFAVCVQQSYNCHKPRRRKTTVMAQSDIEIAGLAKVGETDAKYLVSLIRSIQAAFPKRASFS